jgi:hypothetical protein
VAVAVAVVAIIWHLDTAAVVILGVVTGVSILPTAILSFVDLVGRGVIKKRQASNNRPPRR